MPPARMERTDSLGARAPAGPDRPALPPSAHARRRGQSLVEFALILPIMLGLFGAAIDFARLYRGWIDLQSATRAAAEYVATTPDLTSLQAQTTATTMVCAQVTGSSPCTTPTVTVTSFSVSTTAVGASPAHPIGSATVVSSMPFRMLFSYPFLTNNGSWTIGASETFSVVQKR